MDKKDVHVLSYNIWDLPLVTPGYSRKRINNIAHFLKELSADIICVQEAWNPRHNQKIVGILKLYCDTIAIKSRFFTRLFGFSNKFGGLLTLSKYPIISEKYISFSKTGWFWTEWFGNKGFLETIVRTPEGEIRVINTHLHQPTAAIRLHQLKELFAYIGKDQSRTTILAGDFNENNIYNQDFFIDLLKQHSFLHPEITDATSFHTYRLENILTQTWINKLKVSGHLDYFFVSIFGTLKIDIKEYLPIYLPKTLSDHDPISLRLTVNT